MKILLVDDDEMIRVELSQYIEEYLGHEVTLCSNGQEALDTYSNDPHHMVISDVRMPKMNGIHLLKKIKASDGGKNTDVVIMTGYAELSTAIEALRAGAYDYLMKPFDVEEFIAVINRSAERQALLNENRTLKYRFNEKLSEMTRETETKLRELRNAYADIVGIGRIGIFSKKMHDIVNQAKRLHKDPGVPVLIEGETGTGKEVIARTIHYGDGDIVTPFISINCSAISPQLFESELFGYEKGAFSGARTEGNMGKFELSKGGTIFLDEIGELPLEMQPKLLRVIQQREFYRVGGLKSIQLDARIVFATNKNLDRLVRQGEFRSDLYFRLNTARLVLPPLREQKEAIAPLAELFLEYFAHQKKSRFRVFRNDAVKVLENHTWPGNIRELQNAIERVVLWYDGTDITPDHLSFLVNADDTTPFSEHDCSSFNLALPTEHMSLKDIEFRIIDTVIKMHDGNKTKAADYLGITRGTLRRKLENHD